VTSTLRPLSSSASASDNNPGAFGLAQQVIDYANALVAEVQQQQEATSSTTSTTTAAADARRRALDALNSVAPALTGTPQCAVLLSASSAHAWLGEWREASREAGEALGAVAGSSSPDPLLPVAALAAVRAATVAGDEATAAAAAASSSSSLPGLADLASASIDPLEGSAITSNHPLQLLSQGRRLAAAAMHAAAAASGGDAKTAAARPADAALPTLEDCARLAEQQAEQASASLPLIPHIAAQLWREIAADARVAAAQAHAAARRWPEAEEQLSLAVKSGEAAAGGDARYPGLVAPLTLLGDVYARTARVTFAEGMYREAARLAGVVVLASGGGGGEAAGGGSVAAAASSDGSLSSSESAGPHSVHPSLGALAAWRYAQLLTALPRRETEARAWAAAGERLWRRGAGKGDSLAATLGDLDCRTGRSASREGGIVSLLCRRLVLVEGA
jgi:hypothetical protein